MRSERQRSGFTLVELLAVIAIMALIAAMVGPTLTHFKKGDAMLSGTRQMLDAVARARQLAISEHTTVYMVFVPTNFWGNNPDAFQASMTPAEKVATTNLIDKQLIGYTYMSFHTVGDQPGGSSPQFLASWQTLPESTFIPLWKFDTLNTLITNPVTRQVFDVTEFATNSFPFPNEDSWYNTAPYSRSLAVLPYIAFNYLGQLTAGDGKLLDRDVFIPLAHGSVQALMADNKFPVMKPPPVPPAGPIVRESPPGNSISSFNLIHIDRLTGRARLEHQEVQ